MQKPDLLFFKSKFYAQHGARTHKPEIKSHALHWLGQLGTTKNKISGAKDT